MALTFATSDKGIRIDHQVKGMTMHQIDMTTSTGGGGADYSSGFDIAGNAAKLGFRKVFAVLQASAETSGGTFLPLLFWNWDFLAGKLRVADATSEAHGANTIDAGGIVRMVVIGV